MPASNAHDLSSLLKRESAKLDRCSLEQLNSKLYLRATLPDPRNSLRRSRRRIPLPLQAEPVNVRLAVKLAQRLDEQLLDHCFRWEAWLPEVLEGWVRCGGEEPAEREATMDDLRAAIEALFERKYPDTERSWATIWGKKYLPALKLLEPLRGPCTLDRLLDRLQQVPSASARKSHGSILRQAAAELRLPMDLDALSRAAAGYTYAALQPRDIPSDEELMASWRRIRYPHWRWTMGMVMAFGLRPSEVSGCRLRSDGAVEVDEDSKTGYREVWACPDEWVSELDLQTVVRPPHHRLKTSMACNRYLRDQGIPVPLYAARHAYAIRLLSHGISAELGARLMGHSVEMHTRIYQHWINAKHMAALRQRIGHKFKREPGTD